MAMAAEAEAPALEIEFDLGGFGTMGLYSGDLGQDCCQSGSAFDKEDYVHFNWPILIGILLGVARTA